MDMKDLFQMLAEEKAKNSAAQKKTKKKSKDLQGDFLEAFSSELKQLKEEEEKQKREVAAMEAWLTSPTDKGGVQVEEIVGDTEDKLPEIEEIQEVVEQVFEEDKEILEELVDTPLQEQALDYLKTKRVEISEEQVKIKGLEKQIDDVKKSIMSIRLGLQGSSGGGAVKIKDMDDLDRSTALVNNKFLKYNSASGKWVGADASGGGSVDFSAVGESIVPSTTETYDLGTASKRWKDLFLAGETIDLGGTKISKDSSGDVSFKDGSDNLKKIIVDELHIGNGSNVLKLKSSGGKLKAVDNSNSKASHDVAFNEITSTPTTLSGYGITDAQAALVSATNIKTINGTSLLGSGNITISGGGGGDVAFADITSKPTTLAGYGITDAFDGAYSSLSGAPTIPTVSNDFTNADHTKLDGIEASADVTDTANVVAALTAGTNVTIAADGTISSADTNTTYSVGDGGLTQNNFTNALKTKLDGIEASADVTDATNVTAAGALMDGEVTNLAQVKAFDSSDYATAAQGTKADTAHGWGNHASAGYLTSFTETNDLSSAVTWVNVPNANITQGSVTQHQAALSITESQISDLGSYITGYTVTQSDVTAHQAALSITESQISDLGSYATLASPTLTGTPAAPTASTGTNTTQLATTAFVQQEITALKALLYAYDQS